MWCPTCRDEYQPGLDRCRSCDVALVPATQLGPLVERTSIGRFHRLIAPSVTGDLEGRDLTVETAERDGAVEVLALDADRELARAHLITDWEGLLADLDPEIRAEVLASGDDVPGWFDPPASVWVDRLGRLRAGAARGEEPRERAIGPALVTLGLLALATAWYVGSGGIAMLATVAGITALLAGIFSPR